MSKVALQADLCYNEALIWFCRSVAANNLRRDARKVSFSHMDSLSSDIPLKQCTNPDCKQWYPATLEYFQRDKHKKDQLTTRCKMCKRRDNKDSYDRHNAHRKKVPYDGPLTPRERKLAYLHSYYQRNRERELANRSAYRREFPERMHAYKQKRRATKNSIAGKHTSGQILDLLKRQKYKCYYCNTKFEKHKDKYVYQVDHTFPISRVVDTDIPANDISYLVLACPRCNRSKKDKFPWEFPQGGKLL